MRIARIKLFLHSGDAGKVQDGVEAFVGNLCRPTCAFDVEGLLGGADAAGYLEAAVVDVADGDACALQGRELGGDLAYAAGADDEDIFAHLRVGVADGIEGDGRHAVNGSFAQVDPFWEFDQEFIFGDDYVLEMAAGALADEDDVIDLERLGVRSGLDDAADGLVAGWHGQQSVTGGVVAFVELIAFSAVGDAGVEGLDFDLVALRRRGLGPVGDEDFSLILSSLFLITIALTGRSAFREVAVCPRGTPL